MSFLARAFLQRVFDRRAMAADLARLPAIYRYAGGGLTGRIATAGALRLALRWPALTGVVILAMVLARIMSTSRPRSADVSPPR
jgi:hypothetical protein